MTDAIFTAPVIQGGRVYVVDGAGVVFCIEGTSREVVWRFATAGGKANCNNVSSPALAGRFLHVGTTGGRYYVLDRANGVRVREVICGAPIWSAPVVANDRVYFATLGSQVYCLKPDGTILWTWDFVPEVLKFAGDRWSGEQWLGHKKGRVTWRDQFLCTQDIAVYHDRVIVPVGGSALVLQDLGTRAEVQVRKPMPSYNGSENPALFGMSVAEDGAIYQQWHRRDNAGRVEVIRLVGKEVQTDFVSGTETAIQLPRLLSFSSVSVRGSDVYRCSPENGFGFCRSSPGHPAEVLDAGSSITSAVLLRAHGIYGGLDGRLRVVPLAGKGGAWSFPTAFGKAISAPVAVCDGRVYFGCEDGYLYILGPDGQAEPPDRDLQLWKMRSRLTGQRTDAKCDWFTNYGDQANTNSNHQDVKPPFKLKWVRRYEGTFKHIPVCGGGRVYTHTAEGQILALEQETGRLLWRRYGPDVHLSFTSPLYCRRGQKELLLVPRDGSLIWQSEPVAKAVNVVTIRERFLFTRASSGCPSYLLDKGTGRILSSFDMGYACTRFTLSEPYLMGCNLDLIDTTHGVQLASSGPCLEPRECVGAAVSNGRIFYTAQASGMQACAVYGEEARALQSSWE